MLEIPFRDIVQLRPECGSKFFGELCGIDCRSRLGHYLLHNRDLTLDILSLSGALPLLRPIDLLTRVALVTCDVQEPFCRVFADTARACAMLLEIGSEGLGFGADVAKVEGFAVRKEQKPVKHLEEHSGRLMDCAENRLAVVC